MNTHPTKTALRRKFRGLACPPVTLLLNIAARLKRVAGFDTLDSIMIRGEARSQQRHLRIAAHSASLTQRDLRAIEAEIAADVVDEKTPGVIDATEAAALVAHLEHPLRRNARHEVHLRALAG